MQKVPGVEYAVPVIDTQGILVGAKERSLMILGVDVLQDSNIRDYKLSDENADIPDPLLFLARPDSILLTKELADREGDQDRPDRYRSRPCAASGPSASAVS